jgi:hypothetical protein
VTADSDPVAFGDGGLVRAGASPGVQLTGAGYPGTGAGGGGAAGDSGVPGVANSGAAAAGVGGHGDAAGAGNAFYVRPEVRVMAEAALPPLLESPLGLVEACDLRVLARRLR